VEIRAIGPRSSFTEGPQEIDTQNNSDSENENLRSIQPRRAEQTDDPSTNNIIKIRDSLFAPTDSIVIFLTQDGESCDDGSHLLAKDNRVSARKNATLGKARVIKQGYRYFIALIVKIKVSVLLEEKILKKALRSLYDLILESQLQTISISKTDVDNISWAIVEKFLRELFYDSPTKIIDNAITMPKHLNPNNCRKSRLSYRRP